MEIRVAFVTSENEYRQNREKQRGVLGTVHAPEMIVPKIFYANNLYHIEGVRLEWWVGVNVWWVEGATNFCDQSKHNEDMHLKTSIVVNLSRI